MRGSHNEELGKMNVSFTFKKKCCQRKLLKMSIKNDAGHKDVNSTCGKKKKSL